MRKKVDLAGVGRSATGGNPYTLAQNSYAQYRPSYCLPAVLDALVPYKYGSYWYKKAQFASMHQALSKTHYTAEEMSAVAQNLGKAWQLLPGKQMRVLDVGAGTGKFTASLMGLDCAIQAVEPAEAMAEQFAASLPNVPLHKMKAEEIAMLASASDCEKTSVQKDTDNKFEVVSYAQCWHWLEREKACEQAKAVLSDNGQLAIIFQQLNVTIPWVQRLARVMRSGDVHFPDRPPKVSQDFMRPILRTRNWCKQMSAQELCELAKTRSSYLRASDKGKRHLEDNLHYVLEKEMFLQENATLTLPYYTLTWLTAPTV